MENEEILKILKQMLTKYNLNDNEILALKSMIKSIEWVINCTKEIN